METDVMLSQCPSCGFKQAFDFLTYYNNWECVYCEKCHKHYRIISGIEYGRELTEEEYKVYKFLKKLRETN